MTHVFGSKSARQSPDTPNYPATTLRVQTSIQGKPRPIVYGTQRLAGNLMWYGGFLYYPIVQGEAAGGGKGGGGSANKNPQVTGYEYLVSMAFGLCEGQIGNVLQVYANKTGFPLSGFTPYPFSIFSGALSQSPWGYLTSTFPSQALNYPALAYVGGQSILLGTSSDLPSFSFEVSGFDSSHYGWQPDASPAVAIVDFLANALHGVGFPSSRIGDSNLSTYQTYTGAAGLWISDAIVDQRAASQWIKDLLDATNSGAVWSQGALKVVPYQDTNLSAAPINVTETHVVPHPPYFNPGNSYITVSAPGAFNLDFGVKYDATGVPLTSVGVPPGPAIGQYYLASSSNQYAFNAGDMGQLVDISYQYTPVASYTAVTTAVYDLDDTDFIIENTGDPPVDVVRLRPADQINSFRIEYLDRENDYNPAVVEVKDEAAIQAYGLRAGDTKQSHFFCLTYSAMMSASLQLGRQQVRNQYTFTVGAQYILLDPMDLVTLTDTVLGITRQPVRIIEITENQDGTLTMVAEQFLAGTASTPMYGKTASSGANPNLNAQAGAINDLYIFEPPIDLTQGMEVWAGISGVQPNWGGCEVWLSYDNTTFAKVAVQTGPSRVGLVTNAIPGLAGSTQTADSTTSWSVNLQTSGGVLLPVDITDYDNLNSLCYVDGEAFAYANVAPTGTNTYQISPSTLRGAYNTWPKMNAGHAINSNFVRLDSQICKIPYDQTRVGDTLYLKFLSFNLFGLNTQRLSDVSAFGFSLVGLLNGVLTLNWTGLTAVQVNGMNGTIEPGFEVTWAPIYNHTVTDVVFQWWQTGFVASTLHEIHFSDPTAGSGILIGGIVPSTGYTVRGGLIVSPSTLVTNFTGTNTVTSLAAQVDNQQINTPQITNQAVSNYGSATNGSTNGYLGTSTTTVLSATFNVQGTAGSTIALVCSGHIVWQNISCNTNASWSLQVNVSGSSFTSVDGNVLTNVISAVQRDVASGLFQFTATGASQPVILQLELTIPGSGQQYNLVSNSEIVCQAVKK